MTRAPTRGVGDVDIIGYVMLMLTPLRQRTKIFADPERIDQRHAVMSSPRSVAKPQL